MREIPQKAQKLHQIPNVVDKTILVTEGDSFFVDLQPLRVNFEKKFYRSLGINKDTYKLFNKSSSNNKIYLRSFRGSGKTTFLRKVEKKLSENGECYPVFCDARDLSTIPQAIDLILLQVAELAKKIKQEESIEDATELANLLESWTKERIIEINKKKGYKDEISGEVKAGIDFILSAFVKLKSSAEAETSESETIRSTFKLKFQDFALKLNDFFSKLEEKNDKKLIFIIDGFEKISDHGRIDVFLRDIENYYSQLNADIIFSFPIEATDRNNEFQSFTARSFPFIRIKEYEGDLKKESIKKYKEILYNRIDSSLFADESIVEKIIEYSGGSIRQLFEIVTECFYSAEDPENDIIDEELLANSLKDLSNTYMISAMNEKIWEKFKEIELNNQAQQRTIITREHILSIMIKSRLVFDYNEGTAYEANPLIRNTPKYKNIVLSELE